MLTRCGQVQEELLNDQKTQFHEVYGATDDLAETIWSWRNADDLASKLDEVDWDLVDILPFRFQKR